MIQQTPVLQWIQQKHHRSPLPFFQRLLNRIRLESSSDYLQARCVNTKRTLQERREGKWKRKKTDTPATTPWDMYKHVLCTRIGCIRWKKWEQYVCRTSKHNSEMRMGGGRQLACQYQFTQRYSQWCSVPKQFASAYISYQQGIGNQQQRNFVYTGHRFRAIPRPKPNGMAMR